MIIVTVIVPIYKGTKYISNIIKMIKKNCDHLNKEFQVEIIFVNDFPNEKIQDISNDDSRLDIKIICNDVNIGIHGSRVNGLKEAKGKYILFLDQDDWISEHYLVSQLKCIKQRSICVGNGVIELADMLKKIYKYRIMQVTVRYPIFYALFDCRIVSPGQCLIQKDAIPELWKNNILHHNGADDMLLWLTLLNKRVKIAINRQYVYRHCNTNENASLDTDEMKMSVEEMVRIARDEKCIKEKYLNLIERRICYTDSQNDLFYEYIMRLRRFVENLNKR